MLAEPLAGEELHTVAARIGADVPFFLADGPQLGSVDGSELKPRDLPQEWNRRMWDYLGIEVPDDAHGVLQDTHWASGLIGYFPTYLLGTVMSVQIWEKAVEDLPDLEEQVERGEFATLREWLGEHVHRHGRVEADRAIGCVDVFRQLDFADGDTKRVDASGQPVDRVERRREQLSGGACVTDLVRVFAEETDTAPAHM